MPAQYDINASSIEMSAKQEIIKFFQSGGDLVEAGQYPMANQFCDIPGPVEVVNDENLKTKVPRVETVNLEDMPVQVVYSVNDRIHLYHDKVFFRWTICSLYQCGNQAAPSKYANFLSSYNTLNPAAHWESLCGTCWTEPYLKKLPVRGSLKTVNELALTAAGPEYCAENSGSMSEVSPSSSSSPSSDFN